MFLRFSLNLSTRLLIFSPINVSFFLTLCDERDVRVFILSLEDSGPGIVVAWQVNLEDDVCVGDFEDRLRRERDFGEGSAGDVDVCDCILLEHDMTESFPCETDLDELFPWERDLGERLVFTREHGLAERFIRERELDERLTFTREHGLVERFTRELDANEGNPLDPDLDELFPL